MYEQLNNFLKRPEPFSRVTTKELWTRPHLAAQMLAYHLDDSTELASRNSNSIGQIIEWINSEIGLAGKSVCDLGCGPGLYAEKFAQAGSIVTGIDFSESSIRFAKQQAEASNLPISYLQRDYLTDSLPVGFDIVSLIYGDFCAIKPASRVVLLEKIAAMLNPDGCLVLDVFGTGSLASRSEVSVIEPNLMHGFWSAEEYVGLQNTLIYPDLLVSLDHYLIVEEGESFEIFNWLQHFTPETITEEISEAGFEVETMAGSLAGDPLESNPETIGVIARKR